MRYLITFSYDGTLYNGYQKQPNENTIQNKIEEVLFRLNSNSPVSIHASGRTDAGVHAINQKAHFDMDRLYNLDILKNSMNKMLPQDIYIKNIEIVSDEFHARFDVVSKEYNYKINIGEYNLFSRNYEWQFNDNLDIDKMKVAIKYLEGTHDFKAFTKNSLEIYDYTRTILNTDIIEKDGIITISVVGTGFLRYMVRNIVGLLIEVGIGKKNPEDIITILNSKDRTLFGRIAPPCGLYLKNVNY